MQQCPACQYELTLSEQAANPVKCPECDVYFAKYLARQEQSYQSNERPALRSAVRKPAPMKAAPGTPSPVVVVDIQMKFMSMVVFMIKWVLAAIPAMIILAVIFALGGALLTGALLSPLSSTASKAPATLSRSLAETEAPGRAASQVRSQPPALSISSVPIQVRLGGKTYVESAPGGPQIAFDTYYRTTAGVEITMFDGVLRFKDRLGNTVLSAKVVVDGVIPRSGEFRRGNILRYNQFIPSHQNFIDMPADQLVPELEVKSILLSTGELLKAS